MQTSEKDKLANGDELKKLIEDYRSKNQEQFSPDIITLTPKRRYDDTENEVQEEENDNFQVVRKKHPKRTSSSFNPVLQNYENISNQVSSGGHQGQNVNVKSTSNQVIIEGHQERISNEKRKNTGRNKIVFNSSSQNGKRMTERIRKEQEKDPEINPHQQSKNTITQHALHYAVAHQLPPIKIICQPEVKNHLEGTKLIKALLSHIQEDFCKLNKSYNRPIGFDTWYIDKHGTILCFTKEIELFVYLWDTTHYPDQLLNMKITPVPPIHLPSQHSIIFKLVPNTISIDEMVEAVADICQSKFLLEEMKGSMTNKSRHIRLDLTSKEEVKKILNNGVFPIDGQLLEVTEFLTPPQVLICSRCNCPGHVKKDCTCSFDRCRRCGMNKTQGEHKQCIIKCHHCGGDHLSTDYRCSIIRNFRGDLIEELKKRPELLPQNAQIFIPIQFRKGGKNVINGTGVNATIIPTPLYSSHVWPALNQSAPSQENGPKPMVHNHLLHEINLLRNDYEKLKLEFDRREKEMLMKQENYKTKLGAMMNLLVLQNNQQNDCITKVYTVVNELVPIITHSLKAVHIFVEKIVNGNNDLPLKNEYNNFQSAIEQNLSMLNDRNDLVIEHQRATSLLIEKTNELFCQGIGLLSLNEH